MVGCKVETGRVGWQEGQKSFFWAVERRKRRQRRKRMERRAGNTGERGKVVEVEGRYWGPVESEGPVPQVSQAAQKFSQAPGGFQKKNFSEEED